MNLAARLALLFALLAAPFCVPSQAADYEVAPSLVCDTQEQVERFVVLFAGDAQAAIRVVNAEQKNPTACAMMNIAFMRGARHGSERGQRLPDHSHPGDRHRERKRHPARSARRLLLRVRRQGIRDLIETRGRRRSDGEHSSR